MTHKGKILVVDDTPASLHLLKNMLEEEGYEVLPAVSGELALHAALAEPPDIILLDIRMPDMDGFEVCRRLKAQPRTRDTPVIFVSALSEVAEKVGGFDLGAVDFITKPYQREELLARVRTHLELSRLRHHLESLVLERTEELRSSMLAFVTAIASTIEIRDPYTAGHQRRTACLASAIATELQLPPAQIEGIELASVVHDIGKIRIPAEILCKPGKLNELEFSMIREHPVIGHGILKAIDFPWPLDKIMLQHHERLDGSGYPHGLKGDEIVPEAKILGVSDVVEAMMSHRPYRPSLGIDAALNEIEQKKGVLYEPAVVDACTTLFRDKGYTLSA